MEKLNIRLQIKTENSRSELMSVLSVNMVSQTFNPCAAISELKSTRIQNINTNLQQFQFFQVQVLKCFNVLQISQLKNKKGLESWLQGTA